MNCDIDVFLDGGGQGSVVVIVVVLFCGEFLSIFRSGECRHHLRIEDDLRPTIDVLRGKLKSVEQGVSALLVDTAGGIRTKNLGDGEEDGCAVFESRYFDEFEWFGRRLVQSVEAGVKVAKGCSSEGR